MNLVNCKKIVAMFGVSQASLLEWEKQGKLTTYKTPGGHRRYDPETIKRLLKKGKVN